MQSKLFPSKWRIVLLITPHLERGSLICHAPSVRVMAWIENTFLDPQCEQSCLQFNSHYKELFSCFKKESYLLGANLG